MSDFLLPEKLVERAREVIDANRPKKLMAAE